MRRRPFDSPTTWAMTRSLRGLSLRWPSCGSTKVSQIRSSSPSAPSRSPSAPATSRRSATASRHHGHVLAWSGWIDEAREIFSELVRSAERDDAGIGVPLFYLCIVEERAGRLALAQAHAERKRELAYQDGGQELADTPSVLMSIARVAAMQGDVDLARELAERTRVHPKVQAPFAFYRAATALLATLDAWSGDPARAVELFSAIEADARADGGAVTASYLAEYVEALLELGRLDEARATLTMWEQASRKLGHRWAIPQTVRCRGLAAAAEGDSRLRWSCWRRPSQSTRPSAIRSVAPAPSSRSASRAGALGRSARPARPIEAALAGFEEIGAAGWAEKARGELGRIGGRRGRRGSHRPSAASPRSSRKGRRTERSRRRSSSVKAPSRRISRTSTRSSASAPGRSSPAHWTEQGSGVLGFPRDAGES